MFRAMRRADRAATEAQAWEILRRAEWGVLSTVGEDGWPYGVPLNHVVVGDALYAHCALDGHKLDNLEHEARASFCAVALHEVKPAELSTRYESAIAFGRAELILENTERRLALEALGQRFSAAHPEAIDQTMAESFDRTAVIRLRIEHLSGKIHP